MLVLTRNYGERICIFVPGFEEIIIQVNSIKHNQVRLGISAPSSVKILREELKLIEELKGDPEQQK